MIIWASMFTMNLYMGYTLMSEISVITSPWGYVLAACAGAFALCTFLSFTALGREAEIRIPALRRITRLR